MSPFAMCGGRASNQAAIISLANVLLSSSQMKMIRPDTPLIIAVVQDHQGVGNRAVVKEPRKAMSGYG